MREEWTGTAESVRARNAGHRIPRHLHRPDSFCRASPLPDESSVEGFLALLEEPTKADFGRLLLTGIASERIVLDRDTTK